MNEHDTALWWAKVRAGGPQQASAGSPSPAGMRRLVEPDAQSVWFLPNLPPSAGPEVLAEYRQEPVTLQDSAGTLRVFAACLRCCWPDPGTDLWPGQPADLSDIDQALQQLTPGRDRASRRKLLSAGWKRPGGCCRRPAGSGWGRAWPGGGRWSCPRSGNCGG